MISYILKQAITHSHHIFRGKTTNISYFNVELQSGDRPERYSRKSCFSREQKLIGLKNKLHLLRTADKKYECIMKEKECDNSLVGNCNELANTVFIYLARERVSDIYNLYKNSFTANTSGEIQSIYIEILYPSPLSRYDHCFVMLYYPLHTYNIESQYKETNPLYKVYNKIPDGAWICDPWANIVCLSENYDANWQRKMLDWAIDGKYLSLGQAPTPSIYKSKFPLQGDPGNPLYENTFYMMSNSPKTVSDQAIIRPDGTVVISNSKFEYATQ
ncbi:hypothetical protein [Xenorhabdus budapestensis]|uniref:Uncharacterized protein n=1 Tax=Xenorhabdus budapestensis TaxID=290110 RepID=A0A2D0J1P5_XENBU|nr:hypothetical protein [Xenorhabdus budapestensis]PHM28245.1 hypothetical protein Xbud_01643 [Xenorhabdus budapestensis]QTL40457.1 hypothetical protein HGO23_03405 [Xenorhabdus budapestensis]